LIVFLEFHIHHLV